jgi:hypothetical protein
MRHKMSGGDGQASEHKPDLALHGQIPVDPAFLGASRIRLI